MDSKKENSSLESFKTLVIDMDKGLFEVNGVHYELVDRFSLVFEDGVFTLDLSTTFFANGEKLPKTERGKNHKKFDIKSINFINRLLNLFS